MAQRHQRGWLKKETRSNGETWVLFYRTIRKSDGKRVEKQDCDWLGRDFPEKASCSEGRRSFIAPGPPRTARR